MKTKAWYDVAAGAFYLSEQSIPDNVKAQGSVITLCDAAEAAAMQEQVYELYRKLAAETLRADTGWMRYDDKNRECLSLRNVMANGVKGATASWKALSDVQWMNIVNHDHAFESMDKTDAVHLAVKMTEAKLKELNTPTEGKE